MQGADPAPGHFTEDGQRDDALAAPRPTGDDHHRLVIPLLRLRNFVEDEIEGQPLLGDENELLPAPDLVRSDG